jgi:hypothetical protein
MASGWTGGFIFRLAVDFRRKVLFVDKWSGLYCIYSVIESLSNCEETPMKHGKNLYFIRLLPGFYPSFIRVLLKQGLHEYALKMPKMVLFRSCIKRADVAPIGKVNSPLPQSAGAGKSSGKVPQ